MYIDHINEVPCPLALDWFCQWGTLTEAGEKKETTYALPLFLRGLFLGHLFLRGFLTEPPFTGGYSPSSGGLLY